MVMLSLETEAFFLSSVMQSFRKNGFLILIRQTAVSEDGINIRKPADVLIYFERARENDTQIEVKEKQLCFVHNGYGYDVNFDCKLHKTERGYELGKGVTNIHIGF